MKNVRSDLLIVVGADPSVDESWLCPSQTVAGLFTLIRMHVVSEVVLVDNVTLLSRRRSPTFAWRS